jgi:hypothetical protein
VESLPHGAAGFQRGRIERVETGEVSHPAEPQQNAGRSPAAGSTPGPTKIRSDSAERQNGASENIRPVAMPPARRAHVKRGLGASQ